MILWLQHNWMELAGTLFAIGYMLLSIRENVFLWLMGFLSSFIYLIIFYRSQLYANMALQFYYLFISVYGWFHWIGKKEASQAIETNLPTKSISVKSMLGYISLIFLTCLSIILLLHFLPTMVGMADSDLMLADSFTTAAGIIATWMLARKILQNWLIWIVANSVSVLMYIYKGLHVTSLLYLLYLIMAVLAYFRWKKNMTEKLKTI